MYTAMPAMAPQAPFSDRNSASSTVVTPPDETTSRGHALMNLSACPLSIPLLWPSTATLVLSTALTGRSRITLNIVVTPIGDDSRHPLTITSLPRVSSESTIWSGNMSAISASQSGSFTALVPRTTKSAPADT